MLYRNLKAKEATVAGVTHFLQEATLSRTICCYADIWPGKRAGEGDIGHGQWTEKVEKHTHTYKMHKASSEWGFGHFFSQVVIKVDCLCVTDS